MPRKNLRPVLGKPLIQWTIEEARRSRHLDRLVISSEDLEIIALAQELGCDAPFVRPSALAQDHTPGVEPVLHALEQLPEFDEVVVLQPTSPLRTARDIDDCIEFFWKSQAPVCVSITEARKNPEWMFRRKIDGSLLPVLAVEPGGVAPRRQELLPAYFVNGGIYCARRDFLFARRAFLAPETVGFVMPDHRSIDLDTEWDFRLFEALLRMDGSER